ncbi:MAG: TldD/PmbA family protein [Firmicutes bacterium]|nr:TldD/PmbA family protein [Candidatus Fermentithermobacillaceae bacterium]
MKELSNVALEKARSLGASYADIRIVTNKQESIRTKNGNVDSMGSSVSKGFGVRILYDGAWGFASSSLVDEKEINAITEEAVSIAKASATLKRDKDVELAPVEPITARWESKFKIDPFEVKAEDKISLLLEADSLMRKNQQVRIASGSMWCMREEKLFASTEGSYIEQIRTETGAGIDAMATDGREMQRRSYPNSAGGDCASLGYELVLDMNLAEHAERIASEAVALLSAKQCPSLDTTLILDSSQLTLQVHESCGHPVELDRVFGQEASYAGTSFLTPEKQGTFRYGSEKVNIVADATLPGGLGSFGYDDEGVPGQRISVIDEGIFKNYLSSRETASELGQVSTGAMRADGWNRIPIIRMTNINLEPGDWTLDEMIEDTDEGVYMETNKSWSIDDKRLNFQFGTEVAYEIKDGSLGAMLKNPNYTGITYEFWRSCDAVSNEDEWRLWGLANCGKGEPGQVAHVGHGAAPARFRNVKVGVGEWK